METWVSPENENSGGLRKPGMKALPCLDQQAVLVGTVRPRKPGPQLPRVITAGQFVNL